MARRCVKVGQIYTSNKYGKFKIIRYVNTREVYIRFLLTKYECCTISNYILSGKVKDPYYPIRYEVGFVGEGKYNFREYKELYSRWADILRRCYTDRNPSYKGCSVAKDWHNFQNFCRDMCNYPNYNKKGFHLDKDLTVFGNKVYSKETCYPIPNRVNLVFGIKSKSSKTGVIKTPWGFSALWRDENSKLIAKGGFKTKDAAFNYFLTMKLKVIHRVAVENKEYLSCKIFKNLSNLTVARLRKIYV